jgi:pilus assembly protein CpaB
MSADGPYAGPPGHNVPRMGLRTRRRSTRSGADLQPRWYDRIRQSLADRRRGGRLPRTLRRATAAGLIVLAGVIALSPPDPPPGEALVAVTRDLPVGTRIEADDLQIVHDTAAPDGAIRDPATVLGRILAAPARRGEIITDVRLADPVGPDPGPGRVAVPVRPADPAIVDLLEPGMHVAVVVVTEAGDASVLAGDAVVLVVPAKSDRGSTDRPVVLAVPAEAADPIVAAAVAGTIALRFT